MKRILLLIGSHIAILSLGFAIGIYTLPILTDPGPASEAALNQVKQQAKYTGEFKKDLQDSDFFHWGEGQVWISDTQIAVQGKLAPGPDYHLYLSPQFIETEAEFEQLRPMMQEVGAVRSFEDFILPIPEKIQTNKYQAVIIWCKSFEEFITATAYR